MKKQYFSVEEDGFYGVYYPLEGADRCFIVMLGDSSDDHLAKSGVRYLHSLGCSALAMSPAAKSYTHCNYPLERIGKALEFMKSSGNTKLGIMGASTTGMLALAVASHYPEISMTIAVSPCDFIMQGFIQDGLDGAKERPADGCSTLSFGGEPLPWLPYAYRHPEYWQKISEESKAGGDMIASRKMFDESERLHPLREEELIRVENIKGSIVFIGGEDDVLWDTCKYIRRMTKRLSERPHECRYKALIYEHLTHFAFPERMLRRALPVIGGLFVGAAFSAAKKFPRECRQSRIELDKKLSAIIRGW